MSDVSADGSELVNCPKLHEDAERSEAVYRRLGTEIYRQSIQDNIDGAAGYDDDLKKSGAGHWVSAVFNKYIPTVVNDGDKSRLVFPSLCIRSGTYDVIISRKQCISELSDAGARDTFAIKWRKTVWKNNRQPDTSQSREGVLNISVPSGYTPTQSPISGNSLGITAECEIVDDFDFVKLSIPLDERSNERNVQLPPTTNLSVLDVSRPSCDTPTRSISSDSEGITGDEEDFVFVEYPVQRDDM